MKGADLRNQRNVASAAEDAGDAWTFACPDWAQRIECGEVPAMQEGRPYNKARANKVLRILGNLKLADVPGQPYMRDACGPWFLSIAGAIAGSVNAEGIAHIKDALVLVAKKQSKTSCSGLLMLALMLASPRPRAEFMLVGPTIQIAELAFRQVCGNVYADRELEAVLHVREHIRPSSTGPAGAD